MILLYWPPQKTGGWTSFGTGVLEITSHLFKCVEFTENLMLGPGSDHKTAFIFTKC